MTFYKATITLFLVMDPLGNIPVFLALLKPYTHHQQRHIILREVGVAFIVLASFLFFGRYIMMGLGLSEPALSIAGGIILFLIAIRMIFPEMGNHMMGCENHSEPFIVPLAIPMTAGPSAIAVVMLFDSQQFEQMWMYFSSIVICCVLFALMVLASRYLMRFLGERGLTALERLMGMILTVLSVQMFLQGVRALI